jgi:DNA polymerase II small subunit
VLEGGNILPEGERLQRAVSFTISSGYQLDKEAYDFLKEVSQKEDPVKIVDNAIKKLRAGAETPLFINRRFLEEIAKEEIRTVAKRSNSELSVFEKKRSVRVYAKEVDADIEVVEDPSEKLCTTGSLKEYLEYFRDRYKKLKRILGRRIDTKNALSILTALKSPVNSKVKIIGIVTDKREFKEMMFLRVEDLETSTTILVPRNTDPEVMSKARMLLLDQVICVSATKGKNDLLIAKDFIWPDVPQKTPNKAPIPVYALLISDLHVGSKMFMEEEFNRLMSWLRGKYGNEKLRALGGHVKYLVVAGDLVDGVGVYPNQLSELGIKDINKQYIKVAKIFEQLPEHIELVVIPGNHDAVRKALPQPAIPKQYVDPLYETRKSYSLGNPSVIRLHGVRVLIYHGRSLDDVVTVTPNISYQTPDKAMKLLLQCRHLAPTYGKRTPIAPESRDFIVIERVPDIFHAGHVHVVKNGTYRGISIVNSGAWQRQTDYQKQMGLVPTPGIVPIVNLQTLQVTTINFAAS